MDRARAQSLLGAHHPHHSREELQDTLVTAVVNFPPRQIGPFMSEALVLGELDESRSVVLLLPTAAPSPVRESAELGSGPVRTRRAY